MKKSILMMLLLLVSIASFTQEHLVSGAIIDRDTRVPVRAGDRSVAQN